MSNKKLKNIDAKLSKLKDDYQSVINGLEFQTIAEFKLTDFESKSDFKYKLDYPGIYLFEIKTTEFDDFKKWLDPFNKKWIKHKDFTPNIKKKRIKEHIEEVLPEFIPIYIGKSKKITSRVIEHIFKGIDKTTYALKLKGRNTLNNETFRLKTIRINVDNYDTILPIIEKGLRDKINPIIGKQ